MKIAWRLFLIFVAILAVVVIAEFYLRFSWDKSGVVQLAPYDFPCFTKGDYYYFKLKPNSKCVAKSKRGAFGDFVVETSDLSLRNKNVSLEKLNDTERILFVGDSFTMGWGVAEKKTFARITEKLLREKFPDGKIEVINGALMNTSLDYDYLFVKNTGLVFKPDIIVVGFYPYNDIIDLAYESSWKDNDSDGLPGKASLLLGYVAGDGTLRSRPVPASASDPIFKRSFLIGFLVQKLIPRQELEQKFPRKLCLYKEKCHDEDLGKQRVNLLLDGIYRLAIKNGAKFLVVRIPEEFLVDDKSRLNYNIAVPLAPAEQNYYARFEKYYKEKGINSLDLLPGFKHHKGENLYIFGDGHFSEEGNKLAAQLIAEKLAQYIDGQK